jgi:hypothetical protein
MKINILSCIFLIGILFPFHASAESPAMPLFEQQSTLELGLTVNFDKLCRPREMPDCDYSASEITWLDGDKLHSIPVEIRIRGGWRAQKSNCNVPLLFIRFPEEGTVGTPFAGQSMLPLTTHCGRPSTISSRLDTTRYANYEQYLLKEYLAYRIFNELSDFSLRVRLAKIRYTKPGKSPRGGSHYAFFTEHFESLAKRHHAELISKESFNHEALDGHAADVVALYQFMVGNTDWSIVRLRNTIMLQTADGRQIPVPFDLDMSGLVNAPYAGPPPSLPIKEVTDRYYLGYCHPGIDWDDLFEEFLSRQEELVSQADAIDKLYKREQDSAKHYLNSFFNILQDPKRRDADIIQNCQSWPPQAIDHMAPELLNP